MIFEDPFAAMQAAVDIVGTSPHPTNKVSAAIFGDGYAIARTNYWPIPILDAFGMDTDIGNSSGTIHAETAVILSAPSATDGGNLCITDPFCPNCAKNIVEAGIKKIYIDHKGFDKDFFIRRGGHFETMSMQVCEKAGVSVYELRRREEKIIPIFEPPAGYVPTEDSPVYKEPVEDASEAVFGGIIAGGFKIHNKRKFCVVLAKDMMGRKFALTARGHAVTGYTTEDPEDLKQLEKRDLKYSLFQEPVNRMLMYLARHGFTPLPGYFFSSSVPTSRELVNFVGSANKRLTISDPTKARDPESLIAMRQLRDARILDFS